jgi:Reverse transcriptase (RNA-dependent DNA polymerase)
LCAEHVSQFRGESPRPNLMEVKGVAKRKVGRLDQELETRGHRFVGYADDCNIYVRSERAGKRVMESITGYITRKLKLKVNGEKSAVARPWERKFLGFSFTSAKEPKRRIAPKALERFKKRVRDLAQRTRGVSLEQMVAEWRPTCGDGVATSATARPPRSSRRLMSG